MKNLSFIILGTIAIVLIGLAIWQLMWMSDVVQNYDSTTSHNMTDLKRTMKEDKFQDKHTNVVIADKTAEEESETIIRNPRGNMEKEDLETVVPERSSTIDNKEVKNVSLKEPPQVGSEKSEVDRNKIVSSPKEKVNMREDDRTISINLKGNKPLNNRKPVISKTPASPGKNLNIPVRSPIQHATSTSPY